MYANIRRLRQRPVATCEQEEEVPDEVARRERVELVRELRLRGASLRKELQQRQRDAKAHKDPEFRKKYKELYAQYADVKDKLEMIELGL